ncbi:hypothetical protein BJV82DRAFT_633102 [Fennellomyces sp. T-0311]|nr:hypothetical protein BJV82DRAFT_633102 [Fennellomyces sp. T-0311]
MNTLTDSSKFLFPTTTAPTEDYMSDYAVPYSKVELSDVYQEGSFHYGTSGGYQQQQQQPLFPEQQMTPRPVDGRRNSPDTPISTLGSCCTSPAPAPLMNTSTTATIGLGLLPCTPTSPNASSPPLQQYSPDAFYPEFLQYSKESYEQQPLSGKKKQCRVPCGISEPATPRAPVVAMDHVPQDDTSQDEWEPIKTEPQQQPQSLVSNSELRRQIHIQSEQKRRAQIKDGFEDLRNELPSCLNKKMSKVALLHRTVQHIQHLKSTQVTILAELERLVNENEQLRKFQEGVLQKQALEKIYHMNAHPL